MSKTIGIDLGTTSARVAVVQNSHPSVLQSSGGASATPTVVAFLSDGQAAVGQLAKRRAVCCATDTAGAFKRLMGRAFSDEAVTKDALYKPCTLLASKSGDARVSCWGSLRSAEEMSALVLGRIKQMAEDHLNEPVTQAVISVPACFNNSQRRATCTAARLAGLRVARLINEPTAAALAYGIDSSKDGATDRKIAVYSLGGGSFDVSIVQMHAGVCEVLSTAGDAQLGGEDVDYRIMQHLREAFEKTHQIDLFEDKMALQRLKEAAEAAKQQLSAHHEAQIHLPFIATDAQGSLDLQICLTRAQLDEACQDLIDATLALCRQALSDAKLTAAHLDEVLMLGGMTRMPSLRAQVSAFFAQPVNYAHNRDDLIAVGAAIQGALIDSQGKSDGPYDPVRLLDVTPVSLGVQTAQGGFERLIGRNTPVPVRARQIFSTAQDDQSMVHVHVLQGESDMAVDNHSLGHFALRDIVKAPQGALQFELSFYIDVDGQLDITAKDLTNRQPHAVSLMARQGLDDAEIEALIAAAAQKRIDYQLAELRCDAEGVIDNTERLCLEHQDRLEQTPELDLVQQLSALKSSLGSQDVGVLQERLETLRSSAQQFTSAIRDAAGVAAN